ncbi:MAG: hypothetical protein IPG84_15415 [Betaproteobacteria bacterium]|nr:hypothetical protein [Betaproteobacteria bacterium]
MRRLAASSVPPSSSPSSRIPLPARGGCSGACALALAVSAPAHAAINVNKTFTPDAVAAGQPSKVTFYFLDNNIVDRRRWVRRSAAVPDAGRADAERVANCGGTLTARRARRRPFSGGTVPKAVGTTPGPVS